MKKKKCRQGMLIRFDYNPIFKVVSFMYWTNGLRTEPQALDTHTRCSEASQKLRNVFLANIYISLQKFCSKTGVQVIYFWTEFLQRGS